MPRRLWFVVAAMIGFGLIAAPFAFNMFERAPKGADMLSDFKPFMTTERLNGFQSYMRQIDDAVHETDHKALPRLARHSNGHHGKPTSVGTYTSFSRQWPKIDSTMTDLLNKVHTNLGNYQDMAALPSFRLFPWFFVIPGAIVLILSLLALGGVVPIAAGRIALVVVGIALVAEPVAFQMFTRAPHGAQMMSTFKTIETEQNVGRIQGYFSTMAVGQGALRNQIIPGLADTGLSKAELADQYPATTALNANWVHILNDMTPMIAAMSDGVPRYDAIRSLPPFTLFPWFFVGPGVLFLGLAAAARRRVEPVAPEPISIPEPVRT